MPAGGRWDLFRRLKGWRQQHIYKFEGRVVEIQEITLRQLLLSSVRSFVVVDAKCQLTALCNGPDFLELEHGTWFINVHFFRIAVSVDFLFPVNSIPVWTGSLQTSLLLTLRANSCVEQRCLCSHRESIWGIGGRAPHILNLGTK